MAELLLKGATQRELAERFHLSPGTISRDVATVEHRWQQDALKSIDVWKGRLLATHEKVKAEAWNEFERSKADTQTIVEITELIEEPSVPGEQNTVMSDQAIRPKIMELTKRQVTSEGQTGDPRYLTVIINAQAEQAKILGAHAPAKLQHAGPDGGPLPVQLIQIVPPATPAPNDEVQP